MITITSEKHFLAQVKKLAELRGFKVYHTHRSQFSPAGFPDLCMIREDRLIFAELKVGANKPSPAQQEWLDHLAGAPVEVFLWYPEDWDEIVEVLK